jgi:HPt (histidine-containing phosphotransfer) domain-containing protein
VIERQAIDRIAGVGGDELVVRMIDLFLQNAPSRLAAAHQGQRDGNLTAIEHAAHSLRSSSGNLGAHRVQELAALVEELAGAGRADAVGIALTELKDAVAAALTALAAEKEARAR